MSVLYFGRSTAKTLEFFKSLLIRAYLFYLNGPKERESN